MRKLIPLTAAFLLGTANIALANDNSGGSMDMENPASKIQDSQGNSGQKHDQLKAYQERCPASGCRTGRPGRR